MAKRPLSRDEDGVTYWPVDKQRARQSLFFGPTDPRANKAIGGARIGSAFVFMLETDIPRLEAGMVEEACARIVQGQGSYAAMLYLNRAQVEDIPLLIAAAKASEVRVRWERLWVISPLLSRLSRSKEACQAIVDGFADDIAGIHLLSKFAEQNNPSVRRLFARLHDLLLPFLLAKIIEHRLESRRMHVLINIITTVECYDDVLRENFPKNTPAELIDEIMAMLQVRYRAKTGKNRLSSRVLRDLLQSLRRY